jgi:drug/metabolite transporter (DMT)-like permease
MMVLLFLLMYAEGVEDMSNGKVKVVIAMLIFGTISIFVKNIDLATNQIAFYRGALGSLFLWGTLLVRKERIPMPLIKANAKFLLLSGFAVGMNWILLFEAYRYTTVSNATLSYYFQPIFMTLLAPIIFKESLTVKKLGYVLLAMLGMFLIIGVSQNNGTYNHPVGVGFGLAAALFYAIAIISNKKVTGLSGIQLTSLTLVIATVILIPYVALTSGFGLSRLGGTSILALLILGIIHTGVAYVLMFSGSQEIESQTFAVLSYIDPVTAIAVSSIFLQEDLSTLQVAGGMLILAAAFLNEYTGKREKAVSVGND